MTCQIVADALMMAVRRRGRPQELLHRSDQGSQDTREHFQRLMVEQGIVRSMSRSAGELWDNSRMESFFSSLKAERAACTVYRSRERARSDVFDCIEQLHHPTRRHSTFGHVSPIAFDQARHAWVSVYETGSSPLAGGQWPR